MRKIVLLFILAVSCMPLFAQLGYWYHTEFIELSPKNDSICFLSFKKNTVNHKQEISSKSEFLEVLVQFNDYEFLVKGTGKNVFKDCYVSTKYKLKDYGGEMVILPQIAVSTKNCEVLASILSKYRNIISTYYNFRDIYELDCNLLSSDEVLKLSMEISEIDGVNWCEPNRLLDAKLCNTYYPNQFYLNNFTGEDINVVNAWNITTGRPDITVAVIDCGVDGNHEDLSANILNGYTVDNPTGYGLNSYSSPSFSHGTACAGIIGAINNNIGIRGVASGVKILPIDISTGVPDNYGMPILASPFKISQAIRWAVDNDADVLSCSWYCSYSSYIEDAINYARTEGRNMKGCVVVFSSGNGFPSKNYVDFPASMSGVIAVGAVDRDGEICHYSQRDSTLNLVAPSNKILQTGEIYTSYITGQGNIGNSNYTDSFGGTSAACPQVAGVAALMLSANPSLTENQVRTVLQNTAKDMGDFGYDMTYGFGLVNASFAVYSVAPRISGPHSFCTAETYSIANLPSGATVNWSTNYCIDIVSGQGTGTIDVIKNSSGLGWITANIVYNGNVIKTLSMNDIGVGSPSLALMVSPQDENGNMSWDFTHAYNTFVVDDAVNQYYSYYQLYLYKQNGNSWTQVAYCSNAASGYTSIPYFGTNGWYKLKIRGYGNCGYSDWWELEVLTFDSGMYNNLQLSLDYQSSTDNLVIRMIPQGDTEENPSQREPNEYIIQLWSETQLKKTVRTRSSECTIPVSDLRKGVYAVRVICDGKSYSGKFVKK